MTPRNAGRMIVAGQIGAGADVLRLWAAGQEGQTVDPSLAEGPDGIAGLTTQPLMRGLVAGWDIRRGRA
jgi:hypothetical protein